MKSGPKLLAKLLHVCFLKAIGLALILSQKLSNLLSNPESSNWISSKFFKNSHSNLQLIFIKLRYILVLPKFCTRLKRICPTFSCWSEYKREFPNNLKVGKISKQYIKRIKHVFGKKCYATWALKTAATFSNSRAEIKIGVCL